MNFLVKTFLILLVISLAAFLLVRTVDKDNGVISELIEPGEADVDDDNDVENTDEKIFIIDGYKALKLDDDVIEVAGLNFQALEPIAISPDFSAYAEPLDIAPLVSMKLKYQNLLAEQKVVQNDLYNHNKMLERAEALHKAKSLSTRELEKIRADHANKAYQLNVINTEVDGTEYETKSLWGDELGSLILDNEKQHEFDLLASYQKSLVLLSLPKDKTLDYQQQNVFISSLKQKENAIKASYLGRAKEVHNPLYGESHYYLLESPKVRTGMRLYAWVEDSGNQINGYFVKDSAVIWYANEPWLYVKQGDNLFIRKPLGNARKIDDGWLLQDNTLVGNNMVVTQGGQTLLSEEFKWAIPDENDD